MQPAERHVEQQISPPKNLQLVALRAEQQTSQKRNPQPAEQLVEQLISPPKNPQPVARHVALPISK